MDRLIGPERETAAGHGSALIAGGPQVHLDPLLAFVIDRRMLECAYVESAGQLPVDPRQHIEIELRRNPLGVVIGGKQNVEGLLKVGADQQRSPDRREAGARSGETERPPSA